MREEIIVKGIVLTTSLIGDYDKRLVLLTKERGKITAFAKGARKQNSSLISACQTFVCGNFTVLEGRDAYTILRADVDEYFSDISKDMIKVCYASYFGELISSYTYEGCNAVNELNLLFLSLKALLNDKILDELVKCIFEIKLMGIEGQGIHAFNCIKCEEAKDIKYIDVRAGGVVCKDCLKKVSNPISIDETTLYAIQFILSQPLTKLFTFNLSDKSLYQLQKISEKFVSEYVNQKFKSLEILKALL